MGWLLLCCLAVMTTAGAIVARTTREEIICPYCERSTPAMLVLRGQTPQGKEYCRHCHRRFDRDTPPDHDPWAAIPARVGPQLVGFPCVVCHERIVVDWQATSCSTCNEPVHLECLPHKHGGDGDPYRS